MAHWLVLKELTYHKKIILAVKIDDGMFTLEWWASIKTISFKDEDLQVV